MPRPGIKESVNSLGGRIFKQILVTEGFAPKVRGGADTLLRARLAPFVEFD
jgi:hypothetical protein